VVAAQGGDPRVCDEPTLVLPRTTPTTEVTAKRRGFVAAIDAERFGVALVMLGGGRRRKEDGIDHAVGIVFDAKIGAQVSSGDRLYTIHHRDPATLRDAQAHLAAAITIADAPPAPRPLVIETLRAGGT
jgi:thymidine phosphorylase